MDTDNAIDTLNDLIETSKDGEYGFRASAEQARDPQLKQIFIRRADECAQAARELQEHVIQLGGKAEAGGTAGGALHRGWVAVKQKLSSYSDLQILEEVERGEDKALRTYQKAMSTALPQEVGLVVARQLEGVRLNHDQVRALRNSARAAASST